MRKGLAAAAASAALALAGCYTSDVPLDPAPTQALDAALVGSWRCVGAQSDADDEVLTMRVARKDERVLAIEWEERGKEIDRYEAYASTLKIGKLLNVRDVGPKASAAEPWVFARYAFLQPNVMQFQIASSKALGDKPLPPAELRRKLEQGKNATGFFSDYCVCVRLRDAKPR